MAKNTQLESIRHKDKRANIPTEELRDFVADDELSPKTMLYPRDPSLDPQLVWKGKDEQDSEDLSVPVVPVYIQEKIHPQAIIEDFKKTSADYADGADKSKSSLGRSLEEPLLWADFNGLPEEFDQRVDFYHHEGNWSNRMILGDSLLVMTSLAEKEGLKGKVQTIYLDPPYGIKFGSNWQVSTRKRDVKDGKAEDATRQPEQVRAFRDTWKLGIHSYLAYLRDRLVVARELLTETGSVFVQIGDENVHLVRCVMDEVMGSENFQSIIYFATTGGFATNGLSRIGDYLVWYSKQKDISKYRQIFQPKGNEDRGDAAYKYVQLMSGERRPMTAEERSGVNPLPTGTLIYRLGDLCGQGPTNLDTPFQFQGRTYHPTANSHWKANYPIGMEKMRHANRIGLAGSTLSYVRFLSDNPVNPISNAWLDTGHAGFASEKMYVVETNIKVIERCLLMTTDPGDLVLDPTCGSGTTAYVAEQWGRRWITIDTSRVALALARTRLMSAKYPYYYLADDHPQLTQNHTDAQIKDYLRKSALSADLSSPDIRKGFVYRRVPHVTLKSIANNPDIKEGMTRAEIDAAIARHTETETLYDQPYEDNKRIRVCGPFSVESLSPHRVLSTADENQDGTVSEQEALKQQDFATMILENLKKAGVQNTRKGERLTFETLEVYPGRWIHAAGTYIESNPQITQMDADERINISANLRESVSSGTYRENNPQVTHKSTDTENNNLRKSASSADAILRRVAVSIGPEHGTVGPQQVKEAAKEAVQGVGFDMLVVCGFAFDPHVHEEVKRYGKLTVLPAKINPDLAMGDELLKKTGAGNLFMVFGEPDVEIRRLNPHITQMSADEEDNKLRKSVDYQSEERIVVEIKGVDVYDPTTGEIRSSSTDDIACWFIDTDYNGESFFVRHAYFTGADEPYDKLKRALRAEIDEAAWSSLYSTTSRPFSKPESGKIAVKVINHYGDEVLKVFDV